MTSELLLFWTKKLNSFRFTSEVFLLLPDRIFAEMI